MFTAAQVVPRRTAAPQLEGRHLIGSARADPPRGIRHQRQKKKRTGAKKKNIKTSLPPGACSVMASHAGGGSVLEELFFGERERQRER